MMSMTARTRSLLGLLLLSSNLLMSPTIFASDKKGSFDHTSYPPQKLPGVVIGIGRVADISVHWTAGRRYPYTRLEFELDQSRGLGQGNRSIQVISLDAVWRDEEKINLTNGTGQFNHTLKIGGTFLFVAAYHRDESMPTFPAEWANSRFLYFVRYLPAGPKDLEQDALRIISAAPFLGGTEPVFAKELSEREVAVKLYEMMQLNTEPTSQTAGALWNDLLHYYRDSIDRNPER